MLLNYVSLLHYASVVLIIRVRALLVRVLVLCWVHEYVPYLHWIWEGGKGLGRWVKRVGKIFMLL